MSCRLVLDAVKKFNKMKFKDFWKWYTLPTPSQLGMTDDSTYDALPMRGFQQPGDTSPTWEDWDERVEKEYPVRFFLHQQLTPWIRRQYKKWILNPIYWIKYHLISKYRYHMLDLRQPKSHGECGYRYGWIDSDTQMLFALFNILNKFVKYEMPRWYCPSEEEVQVDPHLLTQRQSYLETKNIHYWWNVERLRQEKIISDTLSTWSKAKKDQDPSEHQLWLDLKKMEDALEGKTDEMIARLLKIRRFLWT